MLVSHLTPCVAVDPMLTGIRFAGHRQGSGRATSSALTVPAKRNEVRHRIDGKNYFFCCNRVPCAQVLGRN